MSAEGPSTGERKREHLQMVLGGEVEFPHRKTGLERVELLHEALPDLHFDEIELGVRFLGHSLQLPLIISSMTGGTAEAGELNRRLASAAQAHGLAMGLGSQRAALETSELEASFRVRDSAPDIPLFGNLGAVQLNRGYGVEECIRAVEMVEGSGLFLHLNSMQEVLQPEGDRDFRGLELKIAELCASVDFPILLKTTGNGMSAATASRLSRLGLAALEVSGAGGTSWSRIETRRREDGAALAAFDDMGISTADSLLAARAELKHLPLIASGGLRNGIELAKCLALGANLGGVARPFLLAASEGSEALDGAVGRLAHQLRLACFYCGATSSSSLDRSHLVGNPGPTRA